VSESLLRISRQQSRLHGVLQVTLSLWLLISVIIISSGCSGYNEDDSKRQISDMFGSFFGNDVAINYTFVGVGEGDSGCYHYDFMVELKSDIDQNVMLEGVGAVNLNKHRPLHLYLEAIFHKNDSGTWEIDKIFMK
jgi:hypothetical protein